MTRRLAPNWFKNNILMLPTPRNLNCWWNFGSLLGLCWGIQMVTGLFLSMHYSGHESTAFSSVAHIMLNVNWGWVLRYMHVNGASFFFICIYLHIGRGLYYGLYVKNKVWSVGVAMLLLLMGSAFFGYVLPWSQMSFWGATVITNLLSVIPFVGESLVHWIWGGFSVGGMTLTRFYTFHFTLPYVLGLTSLVHVALLHEGGSSNPLGLPGELEMVPFHPYFTAKDVVGVVVFVQCFVIFGLVCPNLLSDVDGFVPANPMSTPAHIQPAWYFLFAYAILRSIPSKTGGVVCLLLSVVVYFLCPLYDGMSVFQGATYYPLSQSIFWVFVSNFSILTWVGARPVQYPFEVVGQSATTVYFSFFALWIFSMKVWDWVLAVK